MATSASRLSSPGSKRRDWNTLRVRAIECCRSHKTDLTVLREAVLAELWEAGAPVGAYDLAARLGTRMGSRVAPNSVYRILELFQSIGLVRRVESRHAYCITSGDPDDAAEILLMCNDCGGVTAVGTGRIRSAIAAQSEAAGFHPTRQVIEVAGRCHDCDETSSTHD